MPPSHTQLLRELRVAFSAAELEQLQADKTFIKAMEQAEGSASPDCVRNLIEVGGGLLAAQSRTKSELRNSREKS